MKQYNFSNTNKVEINEIINISWELNEGIHIYSFYVVDSNNTESNVLNISVNYIYIRPILTLITKENQQFIKNGGKLFINLTIWEAYESVHITIYYSIDDRAKSQYHQGDFQNTHGLIIPDYIKFPDDLSESENHKITIWATDQYDVNSTIYSFNFSYKYNPPELTITTEDNQQFKKNDEKSLIIRGNLRDKDGEGPVSLFYQIEGYSSVRIKNYTIRSESFFEISQKVNFPYDLSEKTNYAINIWASDELNKNSSITTLHFSYAFNDPELTISKSIKLMERILIFLDISWIKMEMEQSH
ncbi:hypothetical protein TVAG_325520 [Trichomonas vaginalis G3]|uniref:Bap-like n=1 Tax=Trichomonas vaginalis (strain ATCC PRA-98 / G3) TaxID=412133 RepID=A2EWF3_TRIV3|nr:hypothetical protein TVAGG3_0876890 [Trichomonas vaginalis G3]EAY02980.1 hypothetical protein TVAG_325520 [Trichomonas vaginalis G3]KAI5501752.1 hypothetical protein TVAGG3_0876890 [Trichomonas vaginalis G3]|eukprot:XP_001315203.1 hypothetical protein [Trichomonas vaginalis G3]